MFQSEFIAALAQHDAEVDYLLDVTGQKFESGISDTITRRWSTKPLFIPNPFQEYMGNYRGAFSVTRSMQGVLAGDNSVQGFPSYTAFDIINHNKELDKDWGAEQGYNTVDQAITLTLQVRQKRYGTRRAQIFSGIAGPRFLTDESMTIPVKNIEHRLNSTVIATNRITATDFPSAPESNLGTPVPIGLGEIKHVQLIRVNIGTPVYIALEDLSEFTAVYSNGVAYSSSNYTINYEDSPYPTVTFPRTLDPGGTIVTADILGAVPSHLTHYSGDLTDIGVHLLSLAGIDTLNMDATERAAIKSTFPIEMSLPLYGPLTVGEAIQKLTVGIPDFFSEDRDGSFVWGIYRPPSGTAELVIEKDIEVFEASIQEHLPIRGVKYQYAPIEQTLEGANLAAAAATVPATVARLGTNFLEYQTPDSPYVANPGNYEVKEYETRIVNKADVETVGNYALDLYGRHWRTMELSLRVQALGIKGLNSVVDVTRPRLGAEFGGSHLWRVAHMQEEHKLGQAGSISY